ncbi:MAG: hypothetical protein AABW99_03485 [archaeon]
MHHRSREFREFYSSVMGMLEEISGAENAVVLSGSGTLATESIFASGSLGKVLVASNGVFGRRLFEIASLYCDASIAEFPEGKGINYPRLREKAGLGEFDSVAIVENETSTCCMNDVKSIARNFGGEIIVDSVSCWPVGNVSARDVSAIATASQKCIGIAPGISIVFLAHGKADSLLLKKPRSYYADLARNISSYRMKGETLCTPAVTLLYSLHDSLDAILESGLGAFVAKHEAMASKARKMLLEAGFELMAENGFESRTVTGFLCGSPEEKNFIKSELASKGFSIASGKGIFSGNGLRIGTMGFFEEEKVLEALELIAGARADFRVGEMAVSAVSRQT